MTPIVDVVMDMPTLGLEREMLTFQDEDGVVHKVFIRDRGSSPRRRFLPHLQACNSRVLEAKQLGWQATLTCLECVAGVEPG